MCYVTLFPEIWHTYQSFVTLIMLNRTPYAFRLDIWHPTVIVLCNTRIAPYICINCRKVLSWPRFVIYVMGVWLKLSHIMVLRCSWWWTIDISWTDKQKSARMTEYLWITSNEHWNTTDDWWETSTINNLKNRKIFWVLCGPHWWETHQGIMVHYWEQ